MRKGIIWGRWYNFYYCIAGNFRGRKLSRISRFFSHPRKFSPRNSRYATPIMRPVLAFRESFLREMILSYRSAKVFSLENFPLYGITMSNVLPTEELSVYYTYIHVYMHMYIYVCLLYRHKHTVHVYVYITSYMQQATCTYYDKNNPFSHSWSQTLP